MTTREALLATRGIVLNQGAYSQSASPTLSTSRVRWQSLVWRTAIQQDFNTYWQSLTQEELAAVVDQRNYMITLPQILAVLPAPTSELQLRQPFELQYVYPHNFAVGGAGAAHSHAQITMFSGEYGLAGEPDYLFVYRGTEMKTIWKVSVQSIEEVLNGNKRRVVSV